MAGKHGERVETIVPCLSDESQEKLHSDCYWLFCVLKMPQNPIHPSVVGVDDLCSFCSTFACSAELYCLV